MHLTQGALLGPYRVLGKLGEGGPPPLAALTMSELQPFIALSAATLSIVSGIACSTK